MANLTKEYTDIKDIKHNVEHLLVTADDNNSKEHILAELLSTLTRSSRRTSA